MLRFTNKLQVFIECLLVKTIKLNLHNFGHTTYQISVAFFFPCASYFLAYVTSKTSTFHEFILHVILCVCVCVCVCTYVCVYVCGARGGAVGWGTALQVRKSIPDGVIGIFHWHKPCGRSTALELTQPLTEISTRNISWRYRRPVLTADDVTTFRCRLSWNLGASATWNPKGLSRTVMGLLNLCTSVRMYI
jgi:hypothetical protein